MQRRVAIREDFVVLICEVADVPSKHESYSTDGDILLVFGGILLVLVVYCWCWWYTAGVAGILLVFGGILLVFGGILLVLVVYCWCWWYTAGVG